MEIQTDSINLKPIQEYRQIMIDGLRHSFPGLNVEELSKAIDWSISNRLYNGPAVLDNNYTKQKANGTVLDILRYIERLEPIKTSSGVLFKQSKEADNPFDRMIAGFLEKRGQYKDKMFKYPKGSYEFAKYNLFQILEKKNANACYGCLGAPSSMYYNIYVAEAVTRQGRSYISCSITLFESLLANNVKFNNLDEIITFINNVEHEKPNRKCLDSAILDMDITVNECFYKVMTTVDPTIWIPTEKEMSLVYEYIRGLSQEDINRVYYKNNLYTFCDLPIVSDLIIKILSKLGGPTQFESDDPNSKIVNNLFMNPNKPPKAIKEDLDIFVDMIKEYVYYPHFYIDKLDRIEYMQRDVVCLTDTDSTIVSFDAWYRFILEKVYNLDMPIKHEKFDMVEIIKADEFGDLDKKVMCKIVDPRFDYDFYTDEEIETRRYIEPAKVVPQDMLKFGIINIIAYACSALVVDYLSEYSKLSGTYVEGRKCALVINLCHLIAVML